MPHRITLSAKATSELRKIKKNSYAFDIQDCGAPFSPSSLPVSECIEYTVFINKEQLKKLMIDKEEFRNHNLFIEGEPTLNIPMDLCPGEIGVICTEIHIVEPHKGKHIDVPKETQGFCVLSEITISDSFRNSNPQERKLLERFDYIDKHGTIDEPIVINKETKSLEDGYTRYLAAKERKIKKVPVKYS
ncbi:plasmid stabilization protein [Cytobacillus sp. IB215665]|uniref:plasmid stabilization protein n=1 Tax=Cytobacillus sp. IB215665 TaxID=3097357 RepID=UPI002A0FE22F|nr:plasmid stabilization protein [Cytobacillus sp. IB215665]MDX8367876.1 plasmid stabilization protein [Cytobacillus sp. IB215665]